RALYLLARVNFEQPSADRQGQPEEPTPPERRKRDWVLKSLDYLTKLKATPTYPLWRTLYLEAQVRLWLRDHAPERGQAEERARQDRELQALLRRGQAEAEALSGKSDRLVHFSEPDIQGVFELQRMALQHAVDEARKDPRQTANALACCDRVLEVC